METELRAERVKTPSSIKVLTSESFSSPSCMCVRVSGKGRGVSEGGEDSGGGAGRLGACCGGIKGLAARAARCGKSELVFFLLQARGFLKEGRGGWK